MDASRSQARFVRELRALLRAPYALIHLETHEEDRALALVRELAEGDGRDLREWSAVTGFDGSPSDGNILSALKVVESAQRPSVFVFKDAAQFFEDAVVRRRLRELEAPAAMFGKTIIFLGVSAPTQIDITKEITRISMPLPDRETLAAECNTVFAPANYPNVDRQALLSGAMGLTVREAHRAFHRVRIQYDEAVARNAPFDLEKSILREKQNLVGKDDVLEFFPLNQGMGDVGGLDSLKAWLEERKRAFTDEARAYGLPTPKGVLLIGVQGCGKSLTAKVIGRHWGLPLLRMDLGAIFDGKNSPEEALRGALRTCDAIAPCVLWMDEIEKGFGDVGEGGSARVLGSLLTWQQEKQSSVFLVATANNVESLPPELMRKGRFDEIFFVDLPEPHERKDILRIHLEARGRFFDDAVLDDIVTRTEYFSGSEIEQVVVSAMYSAFAESREIEGEDLVYATKETVPLYRTYEEQIKGLRQWAENRARRASRKRKVVDFFG